jgi:hypothetical protein
MQKMLTAWLFITILFVFSCTRNQQTPGISQSKISTQQATALSNALLPAGGPACSCGGAYTGSHSYTNGTGLFIYPNQPLNFSCLSV